MSSFSNTDFDFSAFINSPLPLQSSVLGTGADGLDGSIEQSNASVNGTFMDTKDTTMDSSLASGEEHQLPNDSAVYPQGLPHPHQQSMDAATRHGSIRSVSNIPDPPQVCTGWGGYDESSMSAPAPMEPHAPTSPATSIPDGGNGQLDRMALAYSQRVAAHHSEKLRAAMPAFTNAGGKNIPGGSIGGAGASLGLPGQRSAGGSVSSSTVPTSHTVRRALTATTPILTLQERRRNSRRAQAAAKANGAANRSNRVNPQQSAVRAAPESGVNSSGRNAKRGMNAGSGRIATPETTEMARQEQSHMISPSKELASSRNTDVTAAIDAAMQGTVQNGAMTHDQGPRALFKREPQGKAHVASVSQQAYSTSGFDMIGALARVVLRPNPRIVLGPVDMSCSFTVCDARHPEQPIIYCSDTFCKLTGYARHEVIGRNCRFLQSPDGRVEGGSERYHTDNAAVAHLKQHAFTMSECQASLINYRKNGSPFINLVTVVPIAWDQGGDPAYLVGFQVDLVEQPSAVLERAPDGSYVVNYSSTGDGSQRHGQPEAVALAPRDLEQEAAQREVTVSKDLIDLMNGGRDESNQWARIMLQHSQDLILVLSLKGTLLYVSPSVERLLGWKPEDLIGKSISEFCHPSDVVPVFRELKDSTSNASINAAAKRSFRSEGISNRATKGGVGQGGPEVNLLMRMKRKDASYAWIESKGKLHLEQGKGRKVVISSARTRPVYNLPCAPVKETAESVQPSFWAKVSTDGLVLSATDGVSSVVDGVESATLYGRHLQQMVNNEALPALLGGLRGLQVSTVTHKMWNIVDEPVWVTSTLYPSAVVPGSHTVPTVFVKMTLAKREAMATTNVVEATSTPVKDEFMEPELEEGTVPNSSVFSELSTQRSSSHIYELHSLKHANRRLKEEVRAAQRRLGNKVGVRHWSGEPALDGPPCAAPPAPLKESFVENFNKKNAKNNSSSQNHLAVPPMQSSNTSSPGRSGSSSEQSIFDTGNTGGSASDETVPTTTSSSSGDASDSSGSENKKAL